MPLSPAQRHKVVVKRTSSAFFNMKRRARERGVELDFNLEECRNLIVASLYKPCPYCDVEINHNSVTIDHDVPVSRGGHWSIGNLVVCCQSCNKTKGNMTGDEFRYFLECLQQISEAAQRSIVARLKAGGGLMRV
jgi:5-methylcytosine-specific restriction endonuclease McrA